MRSKFVVTLLACLLCTFAMASGQSISLESVDGINGTGGLEMGVPITFNLRVTGDDSKHTGIANGFSISSPDDATWGAVTGDTLVTGFAGMFDLVYAINIFSNGSVEDTIGFGGAALFGSGLPAGYDEVAYSITIGPLSAVMKEKH